MSADRITELEAERDELRGLLATARDELHVTAQFAALQRCEVAAAGQVHSNVIEAFDAIERDCANAVVRTTPTVRASTTTEEVTAS